MRRPLPSWALGAGLTALVGALYLPFLGVPFTYDDNPEILANLVLREPGNLTELVRYNPFRPLLMWTFAANLWASGFDAETFRDLAQEHQQFHPEGFRAVNIAIHLANSLLVLALLGRMAGHWKIQRPRLFAAAGSLLFAGHPLAIESVTYISGRSSSLATLFVLGSLLAYSRYADLLAGQDELGGQLREASQRSARWVALVLGSGLAAAIPIAYGVRIGQLTVRSAAPALLAVIGCVLVLAAVLSRRRRAGLPQPVPGFSAARKQAMLFYAISMVCFLLGCLCKEIAATAPALLLLAELCLWQKTWKGALRRLGDRLLPFFAVPLLLIVLRFAVYGYIASPSFHRPWLHNLMTETEVVGQYIRLWLIPFPLSIYHQYPVVSPPGTALTWAVAVALCGLFWIAMRKLRTAPALTFGLLAAAVTLAPTSSVFALKETMVEHRTYLPSLGYAFIAAWFFSGPLSRWIGQKSAAIGLLAIVLLNSVLHVGYQRLWQDEEILWTHAVRVNPQASDAWRYLGDWYKLNERIEDSKRAFGKANITGPRTAKVLSTLGILHARSGDLDEGEKFFNQALEVFSCYRPALNNLAQVNKNRGDINAAVDFYHRSLKCDEQEYRAHLGLGGIYYSEVKDRQKAADHYSSALELMDPLAPEASDAKTRLLELTW